MFVMQQAKQRMQLQALVGLVTVATVSLAMFPRTPRAQSCAQTSPSALQFGTTLQAFATTNSNGSVVYNNGESVLQDRKEAGNFTVSSQAFTGTPYQMCTADFTGDGFPDIIGVTIGQDDISLYRNDTKDNQTAPFSLAKPAPNWLDPMYKTEPKFTLMTKIEAAAGATFALTARPNYTGPASTCDGGGCSQSGGMSLGCGDVNGDGKADFVLISSNYEHAGTGVIQYRQDVFLGNGNGTFSTRYNLRAANVNASVFDGIWSDTMLLIYDENGDGRNDLILASSGAGVAGYSASDGVIRSYRNAGPIGVGTQPKFDGGRVIASDVVTGNIPWDNRGFSGVAIADFNRDGRDDIAATGHQDSKVRVFYGQQGRTFAATPSTISNAATSVWNGTGAQNVIATDFDLDGLPDILIATDYYRNNAHTPARFVYWKNQGAPNYMQTNTSTQNSILTALTNGAVTDADIAFAFDYDQDPDHTIDFAVADGNTSTRVAVYANRVLSSYVECGEVFSDVVPLGTLSSTQMTINSVKITPTWTLNGGSVTISATNVDPAEWTVATPCLDEPAKYCVTFNKPAGRSLRWKAKLCSNPGRTATPKVSQMAMVFDYSESALHFRAGVVAESGVMYLGGFRLPGDQGHLFSLPSILNTATPYWDLGARIDSNTAPRKVYTTALNGSTRLAFNATSIGAAGFNDALAVASDVDATSVVDWWKSNRFGLNTDHRLGSIIESTPAVLAPPVRPYYYPLANLQTRNRIDAFIAANALRPRLVLAGSKDGALHAVNTDPVNAVCQASAMSGTEAWAFVPQKVAAGMFADWQATVAATVAGKPRTVTNSYVDASTTLADVYVNNQFKTIALIGLGSGGRSFTALDVTNTVSNTQVGQCQSAQTVAGPTPLWQYIPGDAGLTKSKPVIVRTQIAGQEQFLAIMASGVDPTNETAPFAKGRDVEAVDIATGQRVWRFKAACPVTSNLAAFEVGAANGFIDSVAFGDYCGNFYRLNVGVSNPTGWLTGVGNVSTGQLDPNGVSITALFSTKQQTLLGTNQERPIYGTIGIFEPTCDNCANLKTMAFFGTGGSESYDPSKRNGFFKLDVEDGSVDGVQSGTCDAGGRCDKYYGVLVANETVYASRSKDPLIATGNCDNGSSSIAQLSVGTFAQIGTPITSNGAMQASLYSTAGALFSTNYAGQVVRIGTPAQGTPGITPPTVGNTPAVLIAKRSWKQVY
jgi:hypothetical protein